MYAQCMLSNLNHSVGLCDFSAWLTAAVNLYTCRHGDGYRGKRVVVVGVGNTACDVAVDLSSVCSQVIIICYDVTCEL